MIMVMRYVRIWWVDGIRIIDEEVVVHLFNSIDLMSITEWKNIYMYIYVYIDNNNNNIRIRMNVIVVRAKFSIDFGIDINAFGSIIIGLFKLR